jgi:uncharacterized protein (TIGR03437 family)
MKAFAILLVILLSALAAGAFTQPPAFGPALSLPAQKAPLAITAADFNGDGFQDIAVANTASTTISIFLGAGNGKFSPAGTVSLPSTCYAAYLTNGDFTGAASPDLLTVCALGGIVVLPNTGAGTFGKPLSTSLPGPGWVGNLLLGSIHPAIADFNGDGHLDIAVPTFDISTTSAGWYLLLGKGNGSFQAPAPLPFSSFVPLSLAAGDFNGDGKPDLVAGVANSAGSPSLEFAAGNGDGTFQSPTSIGLPTTIGSLILVADVNSDGNLDVVFAGSSLVTNVLSLLTPSFLGESAVTVFLGDGKGGFQMSFNATASSYGSGAALADITLDGKLDIIQTMIQGDYLSGGTPTGAIEVRPGNGDGTFQDPIRMGFLAATVPTDLAVADFNGDGRPDIVVSALPALGLSLGSINLTSDLNALLSSVLAQLPSGDADVLLNLKLYPTNYNTFTDTNAASFATGSLANGSMVSAFGTGLAASTASATKLPLPTTLADVTIAVKDSSGATIDAPLFYVSPSQINYAIPAATASGAAVITITSGGSVFTATQEIVPVAPGVFSDNGLAAGFSVVNVNGVQKNTPLVQNGALAPVDVSGGQTYLELFGTGIRNHAKPVVATAGSAQITAAYAGAQGVYVGEDQINIQLPASLKGAGKIGVSLLVDGETTNSVQVLIQ